MTDMRGVRGAVLDAATYSADHSDPELSAYHMARLRRDFAYEVKGSWMTERFRAESPLEGAEVILAAETGHRVEVVVATEVAVAFLQFDTRANDLTAWAAAATRAAARAAYKQIRERYPETDLREDVRITFWAMMPDGRTASFNRRLAAPSWQETMENYPRPTLQDLHALMQWTEPAGAAGRLVLWHGDVGTGKTWAIRALVRKWAPWCSSEYVVDPEEFFGKASYLLSVLLGEEEQRKWRLIVIEDAGELLSVDAKERVGQGLSRLLNVTDGLVGQGLRVLVLLTTNEPLQKLHPAVSRPGRCAAEITFERWGAEESAEWLAERGVAAETDRARTLAEMYAELTGVRTKMPVTAGFAP